MASATADIVLSALSHMSPARTSRLVIVEHLVATATVMKV
jgi:hypothetical protein